MNSFQALELLGYKATDKVTKFKGTIASVNFDLYGCVQAALTSEVDEKGDHFSRYFDVSRLIVDREGGRVMEPPVSYYEEEASVIEHGPAERPSNHKNL